MKNKMLLIGRFIVWVALVSLIIYSWFIDEISNRLLFTLIVLVWVDLQNRIIK